jgi:hypothetical protein
MEILAWLAWGVAFRPRLLWSLVWFLISGWVSTLLQIAVLIATIYFLKYGLAASSRRDPATYPFVRSLLLELGPSTRASNKL